METFFYRFPPHRPILDAIQEFQEMETIAVRIHARGSSGFGFTYTIGRGGSTVKHFLDREVVPRLLGADATMREQLWEQLWQELHWVGRQGIFSLAVSAADIALWDLASKLSELPLYRYLGALRDRMPCYNTDVGWLNQSIDDLVEDSVRAVDDGFRGIKIKVGKAERAEDLKRLRAVRKAIGEKIPLMVDANMCWTAAEAIARAKLFEEFDLYWFEEPIEADDVRGHELLAQKTSIPIAVGESLYNRFAFAEYAVRGAASILQPDAGRVGGITEWLRVARLAQSLNLSVAPHFLMELHIHLACATPNALFVEYIPFLERFVTRPLKPEDGFLRPPDVPGHGVEFNEAANRYLIEHDVHQL